MTLLAVVHRELLAAARRKRTHAQRFLAAAAGSGLLIWYFSISSGSTGVVQIGRHLLEFISVAVLVFGFSGSALTSDLISREKREGTLDLLFLTRLNSRDIILGKLAPAGLDAAYALMGLLPVISVATMLGGLGGSDLVRMGLSWLNLLFFSLSGGIAISTFSKSAMRATSTTLILLLFVMFGPYLSQGLLRTFSGGQAVWMILLWFSPVRSIQLAFEAIGVGPGDVREFDAEFKIALTVSHLVAWGMLAVAAWLLPLIAHDRSQKPGLGNPATPGRHRDGQPAVNPGARRRRLLEVNPFLWLCSRKPGKEILVRVVILSVLIAIAWMTWKSGIHGSSWTTVFLFVLPLHGAFKIWLAVESSRQIFEDRRGGILQFLLCSSMGLEGLLRGHALFLRRTFLLPLLLLIPVELLATFHCTASLASDGWERPLPWLLFISGIVLFFVDAWASRWVGLWSSLVSTTLPQAVRRCVWNVILFPALLTLTTSGILHFALGRSSLLKENPVEFVGTVFAYLVIVNWFATGMAISLWQGVMCKRQFLSNLRAGSLESS